MKFLRRDEKLLGTGKINSASHQIKRKQLCREKKISVLSNRKSTSLHARQKQSPSSISSLVALKCREERCLEESFVRKNLYKNHRINRMIGNQLIDVHGTCKPPEQVHTEHTLIVSRSRELLFDDNKMNMATKPEKKKKENPVGCTREGKR